MKKYMVTGFAEPDYGCEEMPSGEVVRTIVSLTDETGYRLEKNVPDAELTQKDINEGDYVYITDDGVLNKIN